MPYIYKITNLKNNKVYVGATTRHPLERFKEHCKDAKRFTDRPLYIAINKYGKENFVVDILEKCEETEFGARETYWIEELRSFKYGYNATTGGSGKPYADYDLIVALWNEGKNITEIVNATLYDDDTVRNALNNVDVSNKDRLKRGHLPISKQVAMVDVDTNVTIQIFPSLRDAYRFLGKISNGHIEQVCKGKRKTAYGYSWKYVK